MRTLLLSPIQPPRSVLPKVIHINVLMQADIMSRRSGASSGPCRGERRSARRFDPLGQPSNPRMPVGPRPLHAPSFFPLALRLSPFAPAPRAPWAGAASSSRR